MSMSTSSAILALFLLIAWSHCGGHSFGQETPQGQSAASNDTSQWTASQNTRAMIDDSLPGWRSLTEEDFTYVNSFEDTWKWKGKQLRCTGLPISVLRSKMPVRNCEIVVEWMHEKSAGNSGFFLWTTKESLDRLTTSKKPGLPAGIEIQMLDHGYVELTKSRGGTTDWFSTNGDVFGAGREFKPFPPLSPNGKRSFPSKKLSNGHGQWNHYYIRAINGEVRLWVNGEEVSGGQVVGDGAGFICIESEGSPIQFRKIRIRELP